MKRNQIAVLALGIIAIGFLSTLKAKNSAPEPSQPHEVVILRGREDQYTVSLPPPATGSAWFYAGIYVENASGSSNAPTYELPIYYPPGSGEHTNIPRISMAQAIADLLNEGYKIQAISQDNLRYTLVKRPISRFNHHTGTPP